MAYDTCRTQEIGGSRNEMHWEKKKRVHQLKVKGLKAKDAYKLHVEEAGKAKYDHWERGSSDDAALYRVVLGLKLPMLKRTVASEAGEVSKG